MTIPVVLSIQNNRLCRKLTGDISLSGGMGALCTNKHAMRVWDVVELGVPRGKDLRDRWERGAQQDRHTRQRCQGRVGATGPLQCLSFDPLAQPHLSPPGSPISLWILPISPKSPSTHVSEHLQLIMHRLLAALI